MPKYGRSSRSVAGVVLGVGGSRASSSGAVDEEDQPAAGPQQPRGLGDPRVRVAPDARAVLGDGEVEARVRERHVLGVAVHERELEPELAPAGAGRSRAAPRELSIPTGRAPRRASQAETYAGAAAELDRVLARRGRRAAARPRTPARPRCPSSARRSPSCARPAATYSRPSASQLGAVADDVLGELLAHVFGVPVTAPTKRSNARAGSSARSAICARASLPTT